MKAIAMLWLCVAAFVGGGDEKNPATTVKLKPAVQVRGTDVTVGELCDITPTDAAALAIAQIKIGRASCRERV